MSSDVQICNRALAEIGTRSTIVSLDEASTEAVNCKLQYTPMRQALLRAAGWGFARAQCTLTTLGTAANNTSPFPYLYEYAWPSDALKIKYLVDIPPGWPFPTGPQTNNPPTGDPGPIPMFAPSRKNRFLVSSDIVNGSRQRVILSNLFQAIAIYTADVTDGSQWDPLFEEALVCLIASKIVIPLTGNAGMKTTFAQIAQQKVDIARAADGNEARPTTDHTPDWIKARGFQSDWYFSGPAQFGWGSWYNGWDDMNWGE